MRVKCAALSQQFGERLQRRRRGLRRRVEVTAPGLTDSPLVASTVHVTANDRRSFAEARPVRVTYDVEKNARRLLLGAHKGDLRGCFEAVRESSVSVSEPLK